LATTNENPYLGEYEAYSAQATSAYQTALARITQQRANYLQGYGLDEHGQPVADNPFGAYQQLMSSSAQAAEQADAAGRGMGFTGGLSRQALDAAQRMVQGNTLQFGQQFQSGMQDLSEAEQDAGTSYNQGLYDKMLEITQRAAQDRAFNPPDYSGINYEPYGDGSPNPSTPGLPASGQGSDWQPSGGMSRAQIIAQIRRNHPNWTRAQIEARLRQRRS
jgi:hypothetical protein